MLFNLSLSGHPLRTANYAIPYRQVGLERISNGLALAIWPPANCFLKSKSEDGYEENFDVVFHRFAFTRERHMVESPDYWRD